MKTKSRKRLLVSSVAMLLVAMLALGTATYAWFTSNRNVSADGMSVKAGAAKGLQISIDNQATWGNSKTFANFTDNSLQPVSLGYTTSNAYAHVGTPYFVGEAKQDGKWSAANTANFTNWSTATLPVIPVTGEGKIKNTYFAAYEVAIKSTGDAISNVQGKIKYTAPTGEGVINAADYIRVALFDQTTNTVQSWDKDDTILTVMGNEDSAEAIVSATPTVASQKLDAITTTGFTFNVSGNVTSTAHSYSILVWFEGQDANCVDAAQAAQGSIDISFSYSE